MNEAYRSVWNAALGAWVAVSEVAGRGRLGRPRLRRAVTALGLATAAAFGWAADFHYAATSPIGVTWLQAAAWAERAVPGAADRAVIAGTATSIVPPAGVNIGSIWITGTAALTTFNQFATAAPMTIHGLDDAASGRVGVQSDANRMIVLPRVMVMAGDFSIRATHALGGGFNFNTFNNTSDTGLRTEGHTVTFDPVNAANRMNINAGYAITGTGGVIKTGEGLLALTGCATCAAQPTSLLTYTGSTWIRQGTLSLAGNASLRNSSEVRVDATFDISATANGSFDTLEPRGGTSVRRLSGTGTVLMGARNLTLSEGGSNFGGRLTGTGKLVMLAGTTTLSGASDYTGGTELKGGRLDIGHGNALGSGELAMDDGTALGFVANGLTVANDIRLTGTNDPVIDTGAFQATLAGAIGGGGSLGKEGVGTLTLTGTSTYTGGTSVAAGTLRAGAPGTFSSVSAFSVAPGATLDLAGHAQTLASVTNSGTVSVMGAAPGNTLTVTGAWVGNGGTLRLGTALGGSASATDRLVLDGATAVASGTTHLQIANLGGLGALTSGDGIEVISARNGASTTAQTTKNAFSLAGGHVDAGAYEYRLHAADASGAGESWYLRSSITVAPPVDPGTPPGEGTPPLAPVAIPTYRAEVPLFAALPAQLRQADLAMLGNLRQRIGDDDAKSTGAATIDGGRRAWGRVISTHAEIGQRGLASPRSDGRLDGFQAGTDLFANASWRAGVYVGRLEGDMRVSGFARGIRNLPVGGNDLRSEYVGAYGTWTGDVGLYADAVIQAGRHRYTANATASFTGYGAGGKGDSLLASIEVGKAFALGASGWQIEPQVQLVHQRLSLDDAGIAGALVQQDSDDGWIARAGVRIKGEFATRIGTLQPYGRLNVYRASSGSDLVRFVGPAGATGFATPTGSTSTELASGLTLKLGERTSVYGEIGKLWASGGNTHTESSVQGSLGVRVTW